MSRRLPTSDTVEKLAAGHHFLATVMSQAMRRSRRRWWSGGRPGQFRPWMEPCRKHGGRVEGELALDRILGKLTMNRYENFECHTLDEDGNLFFCGELPERSCPADPLRKYGFDRIVPARWNL